MSRRLIQVLLGKARGSSPHRSPGRNRSQSPPLTRQALKQYNTSAANLAPGVASRTTGTVGTTGNCASLAVHVLAGSKPCYKCGGIFQCTCKTGNNDHRRNTLTTQTNWSPKDGPFDLKSQSYNSRSKKQFRKGKVCVKF